MPPFYKGMCRAAQNGVTHTAWLRKKVAPALPAQGLFQHMQVLVQVGIVSAFGGDFAHGMQYGGVVAAAKHFADFGPFLRYWELWGGPKGVRARLHP